MKKKTNEILKQVLKDIEPSEQDLKIIKGKNDEIGILVGSNSESLKVIKLNFFE